MKITGSDVKSIKPVCGVMHVGGIVRSPRDKVSIEWEVDGSSGHTVCEAWEGQYTIESLCRAGYRVLSVSLA